MGQELGRLRQSSLPDVGRHRVSDEIQERTVKMVFGVKHRFGHLSQRELLAQPFFDIIDALLNGVDLIHNFLQTGLWLQYSGPTNGLLDHSCGWGELDG
ncbi:hypothetical protein D3C76_1525880 [compost metagenome]